MDDVLSMHVNDNECTDSSLCCLVHSSSQEHDEIQDLLRKLLCVDVNCAAVKCSFNLCSPMHLGTVEDDLRWILKDPVSSGSGWITADAYFDGLSNCIAHSILQLSHPDLYSLLVSYHWRHHLHFFPLRGDKMRNLIVWSEHHLRHGFKDLGEERLNSSRILCLRQDLQELVVRQEVEASKSIPLCLEVVLQAFLDHVKRHIAFSPLFQETFGGADVDDLRVLSGVDHLLTPGGINMLEALAFCGKLAHDVIGVEDRLQIHP
mmetsp:Transcript_60686/g.107757  ORF Transcript_60686/g.107757 Transcript_60686/m.107757 type:complete len:262 (-) Transcript_60686:468-1253(-)